MRTSTKYELTLGDVPCFLAYFLYIHSMDVLTINKVI